MKGFSYWFNDKEMKDFDEFERKIKDKEVKIEVDKDKLTLHARTTEI